MNGPVWQYNDGVVRGALELDGQVGYVEITSFNLTTNSITFAAWINDWKSSDWAGIDNAIHWVLCLQRRRKNARFRYDDSFC